ncbi:MAG: ChbG/HpnK family deacetylase [Bacteroidetes bacterium]|nr:ChbG/HpnK family deacetylase [Bacteroidota bacterium]
MQIPSNAIANADDFGSASSVNKAILYCYEKGIVNSSSLMVNTSHCDEAVEIIHQFSTIVNVGVHVNLAEGKPLTNFNEINFLKGDGSFDFIRTNKKLNFLNSGEKASFMKEISAQIDKLLSQKVKLTHIDSHCHLHTLPAFYGLFIEAAKRYNLRLRLAQTYFEGNYLNFFYRKYLNGILKRKNINYSDYFETPDRYICRNQKRDDRDKITEIMLHPDLDSEGALTDHFDKKTMLSWMTFLKTGD